MPLTLPTDELSSWIRLSLEPGLGPAQARGLLAAIGLPQDVYAASLGQLAGLLPPPLALQLKSPLADETRAAVDATLKWLDQPGHHLLTLADPGYPRSLLDTHDPPLLLYVNGAVPLLSRPGIAIVGARSATVGGADNARAFARYLAEQGWSIVSGLALGIDAAAHEGALAAGSQGGGTVAVLGTGIDIVYPARNRGLAHRIAAEGALVSEFPLGTRALPHQFPRRNRLVAGLSRGVLVVEAARQSGSLITARLATEMGREVFAIPGSIHSPLSRGCHALIRQGAKLVESGQDIHEELGAPGSSAAASAPDLLSPLEAPPLDEDAARVLDALGHDPAHIDQLAARSGMDLPRLNACLLELELSDRVFRHEDGRFQRRQAAVAPTDQRLYDGRQPS
ncbi:DNA-processing protein DprA [Parapusillimonas granuli]|uniref:DNA-protecting protein DprA n=1 Tax=Parapusillimonas granuli TaxID=380911 RepID=A0A853FYR9_9BURK|nr:DNA-processing protein DprA [Parapusillimonas granuli]MBB5214780.1 DNA processing protein [Parapusillimonas granuli]MEB2397972.1 DNA-processing protein DprA [Alcaligenaceae bacterium]NYT48812.1 DNA-protecting protein DprA [Parapusillimonas granuli]